MLLFTTVHSQLSEGPLVRNVVVQIPKFDAKPNPNPNPNPNPIALEEAKKRRQGNQTCCNEHIVHGIVSIVRSEQNFVPHVQFVRQGAQTAHARRQSSATG